MSPPVLDGGNGHLYIWPMPSKSDISSRTGTGPAGHAREVHAACYTYLDGDGRASRLAFWLDERTRGTVAYARLGLFECHGGERGPATIVLHHRPDTASPGSGFRIVIAGHNLGPLLRHLGEEKVVAVHAVRRMARQVPGHITLVESIRLEGPGSNANP